MFTKLLHAPPNYFYTPLWYHIRFDEGPKAFNKPFEAPQKSAKIEI